MKLYCLLHGHEDLLVFPEGCLECQTCRRRTPGWHHEKEREPFLERLGRVFALVTFAGIVWTGPKLTPQEAANILRPNQYVAPPTCDDCVGPYVAVMPNSTDTWGAFRLGTLPALWQSRGASFWPYAYERLPRVRSHVRR